MRYITVTKIDDQKYIIPVKQIRYCEGEGETVFIKFTGRMSDGIWVRESLSEIARQMSEQR